MTLLGDIALFKPVAPAACGIPNGHQFPTPVLENIVPLPPLLPLPQAAPASTRLPLLSNLAQLFALLAPTVVAMMAVRAGSVSVPPATADGCIVVMPLVLPGMV